MTTGCEVVGCLTEGTRLERHHWAPLQVFGGEARLWPTSLLCPAHHQRWHRAMRGYTWTGDNLPPVGLDRNTAMRAERASRRLDADMPLTSHELTAVRSLLAIMRDAPARPWDVRLPPATVDAIRERYVQARWPERVHEALTAPGGTPAWVEDSAAS